TMHSIVEVKDRKGWKLFHRVPHVVYRNDEKWICPLESDVEAVFDPEKNKVLENGEARCFVLLDGKKKPVGRIAAFIDHERNKKQPYSLGGIGFFDCINDQALADILFETAENWLKERGARAIDGPVNFGEREKFWGLLVKGFFPPLFQENYNPPYYEKFFLDWGFLPFEQILTFRGDTSNIPFERLNKVMDTLCKRYDIKADYLHLENLEQYAQDFCEVYNAAFSQYEHFKPMTPDQPVEVINEAKAILDPKIITMAYFEGKPAGFCVSIPDINELLKPAKGKLNWRTIPGLLWRKWRAKKLNAKGIAFGVHPDYRSKGIAGILMAYSAREENHSRYPEMYFTTVRAHNTEAVSVYMKLGVEIDRIHVAYRKPLADDIEITPHKFVELPEQMK
ncbi:MAG: GNAT family N-acetyltransferase, partial [Phaeodactylibacter sp.]|nr:GNAT family N-acetyltransferase [Phaeodactylibacter sp.]